MEYNHELSLLPESHPLNERKPDGSASMLTHGTPSRDTSDVFVAVRDSFDRRFKHGCVSLLCFLKQSHLCMTGCKMLLRYHSWQVNLVHNQQSQKFVTVELTQCELGILPTILPVKTDDKYVFGSICPLVDSILVALYQTRCNPTSKRSRGGKFI